MIEPRWLLDDSFVSTSLSARLLFTYLPSLIDLSRATVDRHDYAQLKDLWLNWYDVDVLLDEIEESGLITRDEIDGEICIKIVSFEDYRKAQNGTS